MPTLLTFSRLRQIGHGFTDRRYTESQPGPSNTLTADVRLSRGQVDQSRDDRVRFRIDNASRFIISGPGPYLQNTVVLNDDFVFDEIIRPDSIENSTGPNDQAATRYERAP